MENCSANCTKCTIYKCRKGEREHLPEFCPMNEPDVYEEAETLLKNHSEFYVKCSTIEKTGHADWPRVREIIEFIKDMKFQKVGLAFCGGLQKEAKILSEIFEEHGINLASVMCKTGGIDKGLSGIPEESKHNPGHFEAQCNPIAQALILNREKTEFNIILGLCVGHDALFSKYSDALCTTLIAKDRVTGHNPAVALYLKDSYFKTNLSSKKE